LHRRGFETRRRLLPFDERTDGVLAVTKEDRVSQVKSIFASKTFWVNVITGVLSILSLPQVATLPPSVLAVVSIVAPILNVILRRLTNSPVTFSMPSSKDVAKVALVVLMVIPAYACANNPKPDTSQLSAQGHVNYTLDQVVKVVNDATSGAIAANRSGVLKDEYERDVLSINKQILDVLATHPANWKDLAMQALKNGNDALPVATQNIIRPYLSTVLLVINGEF
jgi:hypothetical protein